jgi:superfamily I DNA and/or RNA helicase
MERLVCVLDYEGVFSLTVQNRMAPEILAFPNKTFYDNALTTGHHAPEHGKVIVIDVVDGAEEAVGTSFRNRAEAKAIGDWVRENKNEGTLAIIAPYQAQCKALLAQGTNVEIHTVDSFQGREADTVVLSITRDGSQGFGFWNDSRRVTVALTRARSTLVLAVSRRGSWPSDSTLARCAASVR